MKRKSPNELYSWDAEQEKEKQNRHHCVHRHRCDEIEDGPMDLRGAIVEDIEDIRTGAGPRHRHTNS